MPMPDPTAGAIEAQQQSERATQVQSAQSQAPRTQHVEKPDEKDLPDGVRRALDMREDVIHNMKPYYKNPEEAYERLTQLDAEGRERFKEDPTTIGAMHEGQTLTEDQVKGIATASSVHQNMSPEEKRDYAQYNAQSQAYEAQKQAQKQETGLTDQMNGQLTQAMTSVHQIGTI